MAAAGETGDFAVGERMLVPFTDKYYEAKILKAEFRTNDPRYPDGQWFYFLHYSGWNKKFDEWVEAPGLVRPGTVPGVVPGAPAVATATAATAADAGPGVPGARGQPRKLLKDRFQKKRPLGPELVAASGAGGAGGAAPGAAGEVPGGAAGAGVVVGSGHLLDLDITPSIKKALLDDYDAIVTDAKLVPLPRSPSVADVLRKYCEQAAESNGSSVVEEEVGHGLRTYFDKALMAVLLYRSEKPQALAALADGRLPSSVYGVEHLLRLLLKLPELLGAAGAVVMGEDQLAATGSAVQDLVWWLSDNLEPFLLPNRDQQLLDYQTVMEELAKAGNPNAHLVSAALVAMAAAPQSIAGAAAPGGRGSGGGGDVVMAEAGPAAMA